MQVIDLGPALGLDHPYPGLRSFEPWEGFLFFGREAHTEEILRRLAGSRFLAVVGTSGSGKSSLVRAGLLPALHRGYLIGAASRWRVAVMRPGSAPLAALASALAAKEVLDCASRETLQSQLESTRFGLVNAVRDAHLQPGESVLVVVDQFEELFRFARDNSGPKSAADASLFVSLLLRAAEEFDEPIYVVITMRSDFLGDCTRFPGLPEALNHSQYLIPRLSLDQRQAAIERPLDLAGAHVAPRLVQRLLTDAGDDPDQLPVMQHALMRIYRVWKGRGTGDPLDLDDYAEASASGSALNQHADEIYRDLPGEAKPWAERLFRCITTRTDGRPVRRPSRLRWIYAVTQADSRDKRDCIDEVIRRFSLPEHSLLFCSTGDRLGPRSVIDISHESLIRKWLLLQEWLETESESASWFRDVAGGIARHASSLRDPDLARVERLRAGNGWNACWAAQYGSRHAVRFSQVEEFLARSRTEQTEENRRAHAAKERQRRLLWATVGLLLLLVVSLALLVGARSRQATAERLKAAAERQLLDVSLTLNQRQQEAGAAAQRVKEIEEKLSLTSGRSQEERQQLEDQLKLARAKETASADEERKARDTLAQLRGQTNLPPAPAYGAAAKPASDLQAQIAQLQQENAELNKRPTQAEYIALKESLDKERGSRPLDPAALTAGGPPAAPAGREPSPAPAIRDLTTATLTAEFTLGGHAGDIVTARFSEDGKRVVTASKDKTAKVWDAESGRLVATLTGHRNAVNTAEFSRDGKFVVTAGDDTARLWDAETGQALKSFTGHRGTVHTAAFSPDGAKVVTSGYDDTARIWDVRSGSVVVLKGHSSVVLSAMFSPDGKRVVTASWDKTARVWDAESGRELHTLTGHNGWVRRAEFSPNGERVVTASDDKTARVWDAASGRELKSLTGHRYRVHTATFSPDGKRIATAGDLDAIARVWDAESWRLLVKLEEPRASARRDELHSATFSRDSKRVVTSSNEKSAWLWEVAETGRLLAILSGHSGTVLSATFSPNGKRVVTSSEDHTARIYAVDPEAFSK